MSDPFEFAKQRRARLPVEVNPRTGLDYIVTQEGRLGLADLDAAVEVRLRYIPDRHIVTRAVFVDYLLALAEYDWSSLEDLGQTMLGDLNSELVPRWVQLILTARPGGELHHVVLEDRQPKWDNPKLLARLQPH